MRRFSTFSARCFSTRGLADEVLRQKVAGEAEARLQDRVLGADVVAPMAEGLLDAHGIHGMHAGRLHAELFTGFQDQLQHAARELRRDVELPAQLADIGDARSPAPWRRRSRYAWWRRRGSLRCERSRIGEACQQLAAARPHDAQASHKEVVMSTSSTCAPGRIVILRGNTSRGSRSPPRSPP